MKHVDVNRIIFDKQNTVTVEANSTGFIVIK